MGGFLDLLCAAPVFELQTAPNSGHFGPVSDLFWGSVGGSLGRRALQIRGFLLQTLLNMHFAQRCASNCKLNLILAILGLSRASLGALLAALWGRRALQIRSFLLQIAAQDALCAALRFKLQTAPDSGGFGPVSGLSWGSVGGSLGAPCPADLQFPAANRCSR